MEIGRKTALIIGDNRREIYEIVRNAYKKRSKFIHGDPSKKELITLNDITYLERIVSAVIWKLINFFLKEEFTAIAAFEEKKSINEYIDDQKFGKFKDRKS